VNERTLDTVRRPRSGARLLDMGYSAGIIPRESQRRVYWRLVLALWPRLSDRGPGQGRRTSVIYAIEPHMEAHGKGGRPLDPAYL